jgi:hypothetical protein
MKLYIVYFRTMQDSPEVTIKCATTSKAIAELEYEKAKAEEADWMADEDEDSGNWAEACLREFDMAEDLKQGQDIYLLVDTRWHEDVETIVTPFVYEDNAVTQQAWAKEDYLKFYPGLTPFDEDEAWDQAIHINDDSVMVDIRVYVEPVTIQ